MKKKAMLPKIGRKRTGLPMAKVRVGKAPGTVARQKSGSSYSAQRARDRGRTV